MPLALLHGAVVAGAAWIAYLSTSHTGLKEGYWAAIGAIVVVQTGFNQTRSSGRDLLIGTAIGSLIGWACAAVWAGNGGLYALSVGICIVLCRLFNLGNAGRLAAVALSVIVLIPRNEPIWLIALSRFLEVSWGIVVGLALVVLGGQIAQHLGAGFSGE